jgi:hypothetical protein
MLLIAVCDWNADQKYLGVQEPWRTLKGRVEARLDRKKAFDGPGKLPEIKSLMIEPRIRCTRNGQSQGRAAYIANAVLCGSMDAQMV